MNRDHLSQCGGCGSVERVFLYNVRHRGTHRRLCPACVLQNHSGMFCPICFEVYDEIPPPRDRVMCLNCPAISHLSCVGFDVARRYQCPSCSNPNFSFFQMGPSSKTTKGNDGESATAEGSRAINKDSAKQMMAAAQIALASMNKASAVARTEAEKRVKEAAVARKRAREALEQVAYLALKEKDRKKMDSKSTAEQQKIKSEVDHSVSVPKRIQNQIRADGHRAKDVVSEPPKHGASVGKFVGV
ncbi:hypothetical protein F0562_035585 [Nyssa sinensis]|uniref:Uncharacterized protein n=1 Tax=Nyssa sinensis TaxID=561372 RepID=A0A5J5AD56_9ASTE|nr:hypothetical protein F0562_035585 [Nyssa sinensis]